MITWENYDQSHPLNVGSAVLTPEYGGPIPVVGPTVILSGEQQAQIHSRSVASRYVRFMPVALAFASLSKDPSTKVGALILGSGREVLSSGWNGAPRLSRADTDSRFLDREQKLAWVVHAEANAIANAARSGVALLAATLVVTHMPCMSCAKLIVQAGIVQVVCPSPQGEFAQRWATDIARTKELFAECSVQLIEIDTTEN